MQGLAASEFTAEAFLRSADQFRLGDLFTEQRHPQTVGLSQLAKDNLPAAIERLAAVDQQALRLLVPQLDALAPLRSSIGRTLGCGGRVFICGCGSTGRMALTLEYLWRQQYPTLADRVMGFIAGGDVALVHAIPGFEDRPEWGAQHLRQMGFREGDLLIAASEGGETPFVIGAVKEACGLSREQPYFLYCNLDSQLWSRIERTRQVLEDERISKVSLPVGPMALAGSTRLQAATALQLAIGLCLLEWQDPRPIPRRGSDFLNLFEDLAPGQKEMADLIEREAELYLETKPLLYQVVGRAIVVFTDAAERAPTFSLPAFEPDQGGGRPAATYVVLSEAADSTAAWEWLLGRPPRPLNKPDLHPFTTPEYLQSFDFGRTAEVKRAARVGPSEVWRLSSHPGRLSWEPLGEAGGPRRGWEVRFPAGTPLLFESLIEKIWLNLHSTLVMGRVGRYQSNLMTWVYPTNGKLIDRAIRYVRELLRDEDPQRALPAEAEVTHEIFRQLAVLPATESVVLATVQALRR